MRVPRIWKGELMYRVLRISRLHIFIISCCLIAGVLFLAIPFVTSAETPAEPSSSDEKTYTVYLTFDDGPSPVTGPVLDILKEYEVPATFFVLGDTSDDSLELYRRMSEEGHSIGIHSYTHDNAVYQNFDNFSQDFEKLEDLILENIGSLSYLYRMPGGSNSANCPQWLRNEIKAYAKAKGYVIYNWDIDPKDSREYTLSAKDLIHNVTSGAADKPDCDLIVLMHDDMLRTTLPDALPDIIDYFQKSGYDFAALQRDTELSTRSPWVKIE